MRKRNFTRQVGLILPEATYNMLIEQTNKEEVSVSAWIREAIETYLERRKSTPNAQLPDKYKSH